MFFGNTHLWMSNGRGPLRSGGVVCCYVTCLSNIKDMELRIAFEVMENHGCENTWKGIKDWTEASHSLQSAGQKRSRNMKGER